MHETENTSPARPSLGLALQAETAALRNDLDQATHLAAEYQRRLSIKSNDFAALKAALEKAQQDLNAMQSTIGELRTERHRFANEAMRAIALERRLQKIAAERDLLRAAVDEYRNRCTCDGAGRAAPAEVSTRSAGWKAPTQSAAQDSTQSEFISMPFDDPDENMDIRFSS